LLVVTEEYLLTAIIEILSFVRRYTMMYRNCQKATAYSSSIN